MRTAIFAALGVLVSGATGHQYWNHIRHSALLPDQTITVRVENPDANNWLLWEGSGIEETLMTSIPDGPSTVTATVPGPVSSSRRYGFRLIDGDELDVFPVAIAAGTTPQPSDLTRFTTDPVGDEAFGFTNLDITDCHATYSDTHLWVSITNAGGGFPVSQGLSFFGYLFGITDPALSAPDTVFALMYTIDYPGIIEPGLYKVTGTGMGDLEKIGEIEVQEFPSQNTLRISCSLADLTGDTYFQSWFDPENPAMAVAAFTQRITLLGGAQEADNTQGGRLYLRDFAVNPWTNQLPQLSNPQFQGTGGTATASIDYLDPDGNCPVISEIVFDGTQTYPLFPLTLEYGQTVTYRSEEGIPPLSAGNWNEAVFRFSDNLADVVEYSVGSSGTDDPGPGQTVFTAFASPNPARGSVLFTVTLPSPSNISISIYDTRGVLVRTLSPITGIAGANNSVWEWQNDASPGVYFALIEAMGRTEFRKVVLAR